MQPQCELCSCSVRIAGHCPKTSILGSVGFENFWRAYMFTVTSNSKLLVLCNLALHYHLSFVCSLCFVYLSCETSFLNFYKHTHTHIYTQQQQQQHLTSSIYMYSRLDWSGGKKGKARFYILGIKIISNQKPDILSYSYLATGDLGVNSTQCPSHTLFAYLLTTLLTSLFSSGSFLHSYLCQMHNSLTNNWLPANPCSCIGSHLPPSLPPFR